MFQAKISRNHRKKEAEREKTIWQRRDCVEVNHQTITFFGGGGGGGSKYEKNISVVKAQNTIIRPEKQ